ncbi:MAG: HAMP domain-containing histidine kinase [Actinobacteria bacterium]|nr:HAMP domain-containing histidine kinase [Actinomycetota bacterium]
MIGFALAVAAVVLVAGLAGALLLRRLPTLAWQLAGLVGMAVALPLGAVLLSGVVMFESRHDLTVLAVSVAAGSAVAVGATIVCRQTVAHLGRVERAAREVAAGDLGSRAPGGGPAEVARLAEAFNEMAGRVEELFDARRQLVAWASHDLRTPLASLQAMVEAVEDGMVPAEHYLPAMRERVQTLGTLVNDLFELARIDAGSLAIELRDAPIGDVVAACVRGIEAEARARSVDLRADIDPALPPVRCAPESVERVLLNLLTNALRHTPSDGTVAVRVSRSDTDEVCVLVEDTGPGIADDDLPRVFDHFWRGDRARSGAGAGLGLAIARGLVEAQGGRIWAETRPHGGACVAFTLPVVGAHA